MSRSQWIAVAKGIRERSTDFRYEMFGNRHMHCHEQTAIVRFLDWANGRLERAIRAKRKVVALLSEQERAVITAPLPGLDPPFPKSSGVPWLGAIPARGGE
jgi:type I restriction enzyme S subunit